jgi:hypothetical protein
MQWHVEFSLPAGHLTIAVIIVIKERNMFNQLGNSIPEHCKSCELEQMKKIHMKKLMNLMSCSKLVYIKGRHSHRHQDIC